MSGEIEDEDVEECCECGQESEDVIPCDAGYVCRDCWQAEAALCDCLDRETCPGPHRSGPRVVRTEPDGDDDYESADERNAEVLW